MFGPLIALSLRWCDDARTAGTRKPAVKTSGQADGAELCHCSAAGHMLVLVHASSRTRAVLQYRSQGAVEQAHHTISSRMLRG